ncbi:hypothetical protein K3757_02005 [Sulfitobacter sp. S223]|uniref:hypothetical protein n=1 Tax=Sulfitobacter sp. S223 TaxID=2867023 RepID=UPI0021A53273|nr:hypothetical protein [Sulfitobacter sp. S223]UWR26727.1 hypothetical protein K3757_02005 [Sulfitobacter sp. S223]
MFRITQVVTFMFTALLCLVSASLAETNLVTLGSDTYVSGEQINETVQSSGDMFLAARTIEATGAVGADLHATGLDVSVSTATAEDLYAVGANVLIRSTVGHDLTAAGFSVRTTPSSATQGNARLFGNSVTVEGAVDGTLMVAGQDVILNSVVIGDARISAKTLSFGPDAQINGTLTLSLKDKIAVPARVAQSERVVFKARTAGDAWAEWEAVRKEMPVFPTFASILFGFVLSLLFFLVLGALMLGFMPKRLSRLRRSISDSMGKTIVLGVIGLSILFGLVPITALTVIGLPFVPIVLLIIIVAWTFGYALGTYGVAMRIWQGFGGPDDPSAISRLVVFGAALIVVGLLNFIPFVGWGVNYTLVLLGVGAMTRAMFERLSSNPDIALNVDMKPNED